jgi:hypothetical protein
MRRHQVMKAVLMNSADKVAGILGMKKTILDTAETFVDNGAGGGTAGNGVRDGNEPFTDSNGNGAYDTGGANWLASDAATSKSIPLDDQMGTGQLNARRALTQFAAGEHDSFGSAVVPTIGWDWGVTLGAGDINKYVFDSVLHKDSYVSITLAWDREVNLGDTNGNGLYDIGENFVGVGLTDLDLYLLPKGASDISENLWASFSLVDSLEHIFFQIPEKGEYEFWVRQFNEPLGDQFYAVAWWAAVPTPSSLILLIPGLSMVIWMRRRASRNLRWPVLRIDSEREIFCAKLAAV